MENWSFKRSLWFLHGGKTIWVKNGSRKSSSGASHGSLVRIEERAKDRVSQGPLILRSLEELLMKMEGAANKGLGKTFFSWIQKVFEVNKEFQGGRRDQLCEMLQMGLVQGLSTLAHVYYKVMKWTSWRLRNKIFQLLLKLPVYPSLSEFPSHQRVTALLNIVLLLHRWVVNEISFSSQRWAMLVEYVYVNVSVKMGKLIMKERKGILSRVPFLSSWDG